MVKLTLMRLIKQEHVQKETSKTLSKHSVWILLKVNTSLLIWLQEGCGGTEKELL